MFVGEDRENPDYLVRQLITCIGNKRSLLASIGQALELACERLGKSRLDLADLFAGSGVVSRYFKAYATRLVANDLEEYSRILGKCYLANVREINLPQLTRTWERLREEVANDSTGGFITEMYAPADDSEIKLGERVFYTRRNALFLDAACRRIQMEPEWMQPFLLGPLLSEASIHTNTSGVFKGFYKNKQGIGRFGGTKGDALSRITSPISWELPVWSRYSCPVEVYCEDANRLVERLDGLDLVYLDPPYNQHPYGSNYFMLNLLANYQRPSEVSPVSGIPRDWNRSDYNVRRRAKSRLFSLIANCSARFILISYNSEGFISKDEMLDFLNSQGKVDITEMSYSTFKGSRNLRGRSLLVSEYLFLLDKGQ
jgi:adenine-specific DNA-methyltransferase